MLHAHSIDPVRTAWEASNFELAIKLMEDGARPSASTLRRIFAPTNLWRTLHSSPPANPAIDKTRRPPDLLGRAILLAALNAPQELYLRGDILGDMLANQSLRLLLSCICSQLGRFSVDNFDPLESELLANTAKALLAIDPSWSAQPLLSCSWSASGLGAVLINETSEILWTKAPFLPESLSEQLLAYPRSQNDIQPDQAWSCAREAIERGRRLSPPSLMRVLELAAGDAMPNADKACAQIALRAYKRGSPAERIEDWILIAKKIATLKSLNGDKIQANSLIGSAPIHECTERHGKTPYSFSHIQTFDPESLASRKNPESLIFRATAFLAWLEGAAAICAATPVAPMGWPLENPRLQAAYFSLSSCVSRHPKIAGSPFPIGAPSLREAFESRVLALSLNQCQASIDLPSNRKTL